MKLDSPKACNVLALFIFTAITLIEVIMFCSVFNALEGNMIRMGAIAFATITFNMALWFLAVTYYKTLINVKRK